MKRHEMLEKYQGLSRYARPYPINEEEANGREMKHWIRGYRSFQRGAKKARINRIGRQIRRSGEG